MHSLRGSLTEFFLYFKAMKIKTTKYTTRKFSQGDTRLFIGLTFEDVKGNKFATKAVVQLHPMAFFWEKTPSISFSLLYLSAIVYAIDRAVDRSVYSIDGWSREFEVDIAIPEWHSLQPLRNDINAMLSFLTGDYWCLDFIGDASVRYEKYKPSTCFDGITQVNLFSGGMDSLIGAIDYMTNNPNGKLFLASHYDSSMPGPQSDQNRLKKLFSQQFSGRFCSMPAVLICPAMSNELSSRSRSFMFLSIALIVASYSGCKIVVPENGSVSLNYPLSRSRRASCSTRTTHPVFLKRYREILKSLGLRIEIENPYEKMTKGEMVRNCADKAYMLKIVSESNSCGKRNMHQFMYDNHNASHCGHCMPCMYRKAAMIGECDNTTYGNRFMTLYDRKGYKVAEDFFAMLEFLKKDLTRDDIKRELRIAGMSCFDDLDEYADLVVRTREELSAMIRDDNNETILSYLGWS